MSDAADTSNLVAPRGCVKIDGGQIREALDAGVQLAQSNGLDSPSIQDAVWELIREAVATLKSLPDRERQWLSSVSRSAWPDIPQPIRDQIAMFNARVEHNKENSGDKIDIYDRTVMRHVASAQALDRMLLVLDWLRLARTKNTKRDRQIVLALAGGMPPGRARRRFMPHASSAQAVRHVRSRVLRQIEDKLSSR